jgi:hypothetical protein
MFSIRALAAPLAIAVALTGIGGAATSASAQDGLWSLSCGDLWYRRNAIYARNGYCFKTDRALRVFGNENCRFYEERDIPMSRGEREEVEIIRSIEQQKGC